MSRRDDFTEALATLDPEGRRAFLKRMGAAVALSGLGACTRAPEKKILPWVEQPPGVVPGVPSRYATAIEIDGYGLGLLVESHEGRPTKVEGNPAHPASLGASSAIAQASVLSLYDPSRIGAVSRGRVRATWEELGTSLRRGAWNDSRGRGLHVVMPPTSSPTIARQLERLRAKLPEARVHFHAPLPSRGGRDAASALFGQPLERRLDVGAADVVLALDDDLLGDGPASLVHARRLADRRREPLASTSRLYAVEPCVSVTGMTADHRLAVRGSDVAAIAAGVLAELGVLEGPLAERYRRAAPAQSAWVKAVARDLARHRGRTLVTAGASQPAEVHAIALAIDAATGGLGATSTFAPSPLVTPDVTADLAPLTAALDAGEVELLVILDDDVVYALPAIGPRLARAASSLYVGSRSDATAAACTWRAPLAHPLESWGDTRAFDGTAAIVQPLIAPIRLGRTAIEVFEMLLGVASPDGHAAVRASWKEAWSLDGDSFERRWDQALARGVVDGTALAPSTATFSWDALGRLLATHAPHVASKAAPVELAFPRDPRMHEGQHQGNAWLLETPHPVTKLTWENAIEVSPALAERLALTTGDLVALGGVEAPVVVVHGQADGVAALATGWGRVIDGETHGVSAFAVDRGAELRKVAGKRRDLPIAQPVQTMPPGEREHAIFRRADVADHRADPKRIGKKRVLPKLYQNAPAGEHQWAMTIDLGACTGCSACVVACMAENNVPVVGANGILNSRGMHWLRIDTYLLDGNETYTPQPMLCQHCEMAPCEYVCPVNATVHSSDGLNEMVYNRCVGTRFCSNNCPYKVRRFNWFDYHADDPPLLQMARNPDVTVRARGVMEKCTFCVQRIREVEIRKRAAREPIGDGDVVTACQQACPTQAIVFGDQSDPTSKVTALRASPRAYGALEELGTRPRVSYLARIRNRNEELP